MDVATIQQMATIRHRRVDDTARKMMTEGVRLSWEQVNVLGEEAIDWMRKRLSLSMTTDEYGAAFTPEPK